MVKSGLGQKSDILLQKNKQLAQTSLQQYLIEITTIYYHHPKFPQ